MSNSNDVMSWDELSDLEKQLVKIDCLNSFENFLRYFFQFLQGQKFLMNWHHQYECDLAEDIFFGEHKRAIINVAPGSTKTEIWSIHWIAWCIAKCISDEVNPRSTRWLPLSYSDQLVIENATRVKEILDSEPFQWCWKLTLSKTTKSKSNWEYHDENGNRHRLFGCSIGGQVTGRRAGFMIDKGFTGALILDDPLPPRDDSKKLVDKSNKKLNRVARSRLAHDDVPIVMVQQRICKGDSTDYLMSDKTPDTYELFRVPALINREYVESLPKYIRNRCINDTGFNGKECSYWTKKEPTEVLQAMRDADNFLFSAQYAQQPDDSLIGGVVYQKEMDLLIEEGRLCHIPVESSLPVTCYFDLGINDQMVVVLCQFYGKEIRVISCYANRDESMSHYIHWLIDFRDKYNIRYDKFYAPHDIEVRNLMTRRTRREEAKEMGINFTVVPRVESKKASIDALKILFPRIWIDKVRCDTDISGNVGEFANHTLVKALKTLRREWDHDNERYKDETGPKWCTDFTDAIQQMGLVFRDPKEKYNRKPLGRVGDSHGWMKS